MIKKKKKKEIDERIKLFPAESNLGEQGLVMEQTMGKVKMKIAPERHRDQSNHEASKSTSGRKGNGIREIRQSVGGPEKGKDIFKPNPDDHA